MEIIEFLKKQKRQTLSKLNLWEAYRSDYEECKRWQYHNPNVKTQNALLRYVVFNSAYAAHVLNKPITEFIGTSVSVWLCLPAPTLLMILVKHYIPVHSWISLLVSAFVAAILGYVFMFSIYGRDKLMSVFEKVGRKH